MESISNVASVGGGSAEYTAGNGINIDDENLEISTDNLQSDDMKDIITPLPGVIIDGVKAKVENNIIWIENRPVMLTESLNVYINPQTGVDNYEGGYGFSAAKPFASIDYALNNTPKLPFPHTNNSGQAKNISFHLSGTFTSTAIKQYTFEFPASRFYLYIDGDVILNNVTLQFFDCRYVILRLNGNLTFNITNTSLTSVIRVITVAQSLIAVDSPNATAQTPYSIIINGNSTSKSYIRGIEVTGSTMYNSVNNTSIEVNQCNIGFNVINGSSTYYLTTKGLNNNTVFNASGGIIMYGNNSATGTNITKTSYGGRIYTGAQ